MYPCVLVPVDLSEGNARALQAADALAKGPNARVVLVHAIEPVVGAEPGELQAFYDGLAEKARERLGAWAKPLAHDDRCVEVEVVLGKRVQTILDVAQREGCDLIVLATHEFAPDRAGGTLGTISHQVALLAPCTVLLVR